MANDSIVFDWLVRLPGLGKGRLARKASGKVTGVSSQIVSVLSAHIA